MEAIDRFVLRIRRRETPFHDRLYRIAKAIRTVRMPTVPVLYRMLYEERRLRHVVWGNLLRVLYYEPMFRSRCEEVGHGLRLLDGIPLLMGVIRLRIGNEVTLSGVTTFVGSKNAPDAVLEIGDGSYVGYQTTIVTGLGVHIGRSVLIANRVFLVGDDGHPLDADARARNEASPTSELRCIRIEDRAWIGEGAIVLKGITIGRDAVVAAGSVVTRDVPAGTVVAGNPARVVRRPSDAAGRADRPA